MFLLPINTYRAPRRSKESVRFRLNAWLICVWLILSAILGPPTTICLKTRDITTQPLRPRYFLQTGSTPPLQLENSHLCFSTLRCAQTRKRSTRKGPAPATRRPPSIISRTSRRTDISCTSEPFGFTFIGQDVEIHTNEPDSHKGALRRKGWLERTRKRGQRAIPEVGNQEASYSSSESLDNSPGPDPASRTLSSHPVKE